MITKEDYYCISCDNCKETFIDEHTGYSAMPTKENIWELANNRDWIHHEFKHYCPKCWSMDDNDVIEINEDRLK